MRTFAIGDIHGAYRALKQVLDRSGFDHNRDRLISLGDVADTWPEVPECVEELLKIRNLIAVAGNHDVWLRDFLLKGQAPDIWLRQGGEESRQGYIRKGLLGETSHRNFFKNQVPYFVDESNRLYVHGGFDPNRFIPLQVLSELAWDRSLWKRVNLLHREEVTQYRDVNEFKEVFIGHTPTLLIEPKSLPVQRLNVWNLDTGVKAGAKLTLMNVDTHEFVQSDRVDHLYPH